MRWIHAALAGMLASPPGGSLCESTLRHRERSPQSCVAHSRAERAESQAPPDASGEVTQGRQQGGTAGAAAGRGGKAGADRGPAQRFGLPKAPPRTPGAIRLGSYNVLNLFDDKDDPRLSGQFDDLPMAIDPDRAATIAAAIRELDADVLALQEVESEEAVRWFVQRWLKGAGYEHIASRDVGNPRGIECAVISRFPITDVRTFTDADLDDVVRAGEGWAPRPADAPPRGRLRYQRSPLMVTVKTPDDYTLTLFSIHHKASAGFEFLREAEALKTASLVRALEKQDPARNIALLGDFNAAPWDKSLRVYLENGLVDLFAARTTDRNKPESRRWRTHESERVLDYILLNRAAYREYVPGSSFVLGTLHPGDDYDYRTQKPPKGYASDHYPIAVEVLPPDQK
jgi:endonuclease/exonuclease/phosphatase family metal-dependent hydrolase